MVNGEPAGMCLRLCFGDGQPQGPQSEPHRWSRRRRSAGCCPALPLRPVPCGLALRVHVPTLVVSPNSLPFPHPTKASVASGELETQWRVQPRTLAMWSLRSSVLGGCEVTGNAIKKACPRQSQLRRARRCRVPPCDGNWRIPGVRTGAWWRPEGQCRKSKESGMISFPFWL